MPGCLYLATAKRIAYSAMMNAILSLKSPFSADLCGLRQISERRWKGGSNGAENASEWTQKGIVHNRGVIHRQQVKIGASAKRKGKNREIP